MTKRAKTPDRDAMQDIRKGLTRPQGRAKGRGEQRIASAMGGASDASSGGGAGAGIPDADTQMVTRGAASRGNVKRDRERLFPETTKRKKATTKGARRPQAKRRTGK
ncbi:MAG: hypothetical protein ACM359_13890 [Bacillota bacterium]